MPPRGLHDALFGERVVNIKLLVLVEGKNVAFAGFNDKVNMLPEAPGQLHKRLVGLAAPHIKQGSVDVIDSASKRVVALENFWIDIPATAVLLKRTV